MLSYVTPTRAQCNRRPTPYTTPLLCYIVILEPHAGQFELLISYTIPYQYITSGRRKLRLKTCGGTSHAFPPRGQREYSALSEGEWRLRVLPLYMAYVLGYSHPTIDVQTRDRRQGEHDNNWKEMDSSSRQLALTHVERCTMTLLLCFDATNTRCVAQPLATHPIELSLFFLVVVHVHRPQTPGTDTSVPRPSTRWLIDVIHRGANEMSTGVLPCICEYTKYRSVQSPEHDTKNTR